PGRGKPDGVAEAGGQGGRCGGAREPWWGKVRAADGHQADEGRKGQGPDEVQGRVAERIRGAAPAERIEAPRHARDGHERRPERRGRGKPGRNEIGQPRERDREPDSLQPLESFPRSRSEERRVGKE